MALSGWSHYAELTVDGTVPALSGSITGIAKVAIPAALKAVCQANGEDLRVTDDADNLLDYGIEDWSAAAPIVHFRRTDWATGNTVCRAYGGNGGASDAQNKANVSQDFELYLPLGDAGPTTAVDWTSNGNNGTQSGGVTFGATGKVGKGCSCAGDDDYLQGSSTLVLGTQDFSVLLWLKTTAATNGIINERLNDTDVAAGWALYTVSGRLRTLVIAAQTPIGYISTATVNDGSYHRVGATYDRDGNATGWIDGLPQDTLDIS